MKKLILTALAAIGFVAYAEYSSIDLVNGENRISRDAQVLALDVISTANTSAVTAKTVRIVSSYTNCVKIAVVTNGIGEVSTVTNRWKGLKATAYRTNDLASATCVNGTARADVNKFILGGDTVVVSGITNLGETVKAKLIIKK